MATPTPMKHAHSQQGRTPSQVAAATPPVSTPFSIAAQAAFSPRGPKSSPQHVKKSPATSNLAGQSALGAFNFDSPSTAAAMGALGLGGTFDLGLDNVGVGTLDVIGAALASEGEKLKKLDSILETLSYKKGLVSEKNLERLAQRIGLELLSEEQRTPGGRKTRTLAIAGSAIALDIVLDNNIVQTVSLAYHGSALSVSEHMDAAGRILWKDLTLLPNQSPLTKSLQGFARNFERLAGLDKLSIVPGLDCHEALAGILVSLRRLYDWDLARLREEPTSRDKSEKVLSNIVMCSKHGYPVMHDRDVVGLAIHYWKQRRFAIPSADESDEKCKVWSMLLGCAVLAGLGIPPVRVSENWISKDVIKEDTTLEPGKPILDWQEPDNVSLPQSEDTKDAGMDLLQPDLSTTRVPRVMFTVTFNPPIVLPQNDWARLYMYADTSPPNINGDLGHRGQPLTPPTFDSLFFPVDPDVKNDSSEPRAIHRSRRVRGFNKDLREDVKDHNTTLFIYKPIYSQTVSEMPFSHPRQLIDMLPLLRQYAFLSTLLENSFGSEPTPTASANQASSTPERQLVSNADTAVPPPTNTAHGSTDFSDLRDSPAPDDSLYLHATLWVHPSPNLQVVFPMGQFTADVSLKILDGGVVDIVNENILEAIKKNKENSGTKDDGTRGPFTREKMAKVLEHFEDLCQWAEWLRTRLL